MAKAPSPKLEAQKRNAAARLAKPTPPPKPVAMDGGPEHHEDVLADVEEAAGLDKVKLSIRLNAGTHREVKIAAAEDGVTIDTFVATAIRRKLSERANR